MTDVRAQLVERISQATLTTDGRHLVMQAQHDGSPIALAFLAQEFFSLVAALSKDVIGPGQAGSGSVAAQPTSTGTVPPSWLSWLSNTETLEFGAYPSAIRAHPAI